MHKSFLSQNIFCGSGSILCDFSVRMELEHITTESVNENENKENKKLIKMNFKNTFCNKYWQTQG